MVNHVIKKLKNYIARKKFICSSALSNYTSTACAKKYEKVGFLVNLLSTQFKKCNTKK